MQTERIIRTDLDHFWDALYCTFITPETGSTPAKP